MELQVKQLVDDWERTGIANLHLDGRIHWKAKASLVTAIVQRFRTIELRDVKDGAYVAGEGNALHALQTPNSTKSEGQSAKSSDNNQQSTQNVDSSPEPKKKDLRAYNRSKRKLIPRDPKYRDESLSKKKGKKR